MIKENDKIDKPTSFNEIIRYDAYGRKLQAEAFKHFFKKARYYLSELFNHLK